MEAVDATQTAVARWVIDPTHSDVGFSVRHMMITKVKGRFSDVEGYIEFHEADLTGAKIEVDVKTASVDTRQEQRDNHLRSADFFDAERYPVMRFISKRVEETGKNRYRVVGDLTIRDVTREVELEATFDGIHPDPWGNLRAGFSATGQVNRHDFGLNWNQAIEGGGVVVGDTVQISLDVEAVKQA